MLLTASLIVRNEERFLDACLTSLRDRVDEILIVDTGSVDRSMEIARDHGARLIESSWTGDFSLARNTGLEAARGRWILYIDADERVTQLDRDSLEPVLADPRCAACTVLFRPTSGFTRYRETRLFRNRPDVRFKGLIHESILPDLEDLLRREDMYTAPSQVAIDHYGYDGDLSHKHRRNRPMLEARLAMDPHHVYSRDHLGQTMLALGDPAGAEQAFRMAIASSLQCPTDPAVDSLPYLHLATLLMDQGRDAASILDEAGRRFPDNLALHWLHARRAFEEGRHADALDLFTALTQVDPENCSDGRIAYDSRLFGAPLYMAIGQCLLRMGHHAEAEAQFARAQMLDPDNLEIRTKRQWASILARDKEGSQATQLP